MKTRSLGFFHRHYEYFLKVAEVGSFTLAAETLGVTQSGLSHAITALEKEWDLKLFDRLPRGVKLTPQGRKFFELCKDQLAGFQQGVVKAKLAPSESTEIRIASVEHFAQKFLFPILDKIQKSVTLQLFMVRSYAAFNAVEEGHVDFAFVTWSRKPSGLSSRKLRNEPLAIVGLKKKFSHLSKVNTLEELKNEIWIQTPKPQYEWWESISSQTRGYVAGGFYSQKEALLAGLGIGEAQLDAFSEEEQKKLIKIPVPSLHTAAGQYLIFRSNLENSKIEFMNSLVNKLSL